MSRHQDPVYLTHMLEAGRRIEAYLRHADWDQFRDDAMRQDAVIRQMEILGEASAHVSLAFQAAHPQIPWAKVKALRNQLIHGYNDVKLNRVWEIALHNVPELVRTLQPLLNAPDATLGRTAASQPAPDSPAHLPQAPAPEGAKPAPDEDARAADDPEGAR